MESIKEARKKAGLSQAKMSELFKIPRRTLEDWDRGIASPPHWAELLIIEKLEAIAKRNEEEAE